MDLENATELEGYDSFPAWLRGSIAGWLVRKGMKDEIVHYAARLNSAGNVARVELHTNTGVIPIRFEKTS